MTGDLHAFHVVGTAVVRWDARGRALCGCVSFPRCQDGGQGMEVGSPRKAHSRCGRGDERGEENLMGDGDSVSLSLSLSLTHTYVHVDLHSP